LPWLIDPATADIVVDGERIKTSKPRGASRSEPRHAYILLNKPIHVVCTNVAQHSQGFEQTRAIDLLPREFRRRVWPVGRLDATSRGLLLLTDDGDLTHRLTHPSFGVAKTYRIVCDGMVTPDVADKLGDGIFLVDRETQRGSKTAPAALKIVRRDRERSILELTIKEGRNRQLRRMLAAVGHKVRDLRRTRIGPLQMRELPEGSSRPLSRSELSALRSAVGLRHEAQR
jgi:pseudouridine synthase